MLIKQKSTVTNRNGIFSQSRCLISEIQKKVKKKHLELNKELNVIGQEPFFSKLGMEKPGDSQSYFLGDF